MSDTSIEAAAPAATIARRCRASDTGCLGLWGGWCAGNRTMRETASVSFTSIAIRRWPLWKGSNVPPKSATDVRTDSTYARTWPSPKAMNFVVVNSSRPIGPNA
jgi:hypothetical protein